MDFDMIDVIGFTGECDRTFDAKNRIVMPPVYKDNFDEVFYVVCFPNDTCLRIYNKEELNRILVEKVFTQNCGENGQELQRYIFSRMAKCNLDSQNRFTVPQKLIDLAGIEKDVTMLGIGSRVELWNPALYNEKVENASAEKYKSFSPDF